MQGKIEKVVKKRASTPRYVSPNQLTLVGFETPFDHQLSRSNRWVKMAQAIPWDSIVGQYNKLFTSREGRPPISGRVVLGAIVIKHYLNLSDRETIAQIRENMFMQYFLGYSSFTNEEPFSATLFVEIRERLSLEILSKINDVIAVLCIEKEEVLEDKKKSVSSGKDNKPSGDPPVGGNQDSSKFVTKAPPAEPETQQGLQTEQILQTPGIVHAADIQQTDGSTRDVKAPLKKENKGRLLMDATAAPQDITFPTDLKLLNAARKKSEELIDILYSPSLHGDTKVRTYRKIARKEFLNAAKKKRKTSKEIYKANGRQIRFLRRNLGHIDTLLGSYEKFPLTAQQQKYLMVLHTVNDQQEEMHRTHTRRIDYRIVNIHQPHVRPIVRGKESAKVEFGSKLQVSVVAGYTFIDHFSWEAFNEGGYLLASVEKYKGRFGFYPAEVLADQIYCTRDNRQELKLLDIKLIAKPLGRRSAKAVKVHLSPGKRNPIEGKFGQAKRKYGLQNVKARLSSTSQSWIAAIALVLNLVRMTRGALVGLIQAIRVIWKGRSTAYWPVIMYTGARKLKNLQGPSF
jgi:transposase, IS5 family